MSKEIQLFFTALMFYTRIPCPPLPHYSPEQLSQATRYLPLIGWIVGGITAGIAYGLSYFWPPTLAILLALAAGIWLTGAFHEDGLADFFDGFGGGWTKAQILEIMKDSRIGTYGMVGLSIVLLLRLHSLTALPVAQWASILIAGHSISRLAAVSVIYLAEYVREDANSKAKPIALGISHRALCIAAGFGLAPLLFLPSLWCSLALLPVIAMTFYLYTVLQRRLGGYTGDCLGAIQQLTEVVFYLTMVTQFWTFF